MNVLNKLESHPQLATDAQIEQLALERYTAGTQVARTDGIYLHVLVAACQAKLGPLKRGRAPNPQAQLAVLETVHTRFYAAVLRGVTTPDVEPAEGLDDAERNRRTLARNSRSTFARTAKATLAAYAKVGGDIRSLEPTTTSKAQLRAVVAPPVVGTKIQQRIQRSEGALLRAVRRMAKDDPDEARDTLERSIEALRKVLASLDGEPEVEPSSVRMPPGAREGAHARTRVGAVMLNRPAGL